MTIIEDKQTMFFGVLFDCVRSLDLLETKTGMKIFISESNKSQLQSKQLKTPKRPSVREGL